MKDNTIRLRNCYNLLSTRLNIILTRNEFQNCNNNIFTYNNIILRKIYQISYVSQSENTKQSAKQFAPNPNKITKGAYFLVSEIVSMNQKVRNTTQPPVKYPPK